MYYAFLKGFLLYFQQVCSYLTIYLCVLLVHWCVLDMSIVVLITLVIM